MEYVVTAEILLRHKTELGSKYQIFRTPNERTNEPTNEPVSRSAKQLTNQPTNQPTSQSVGQQNNQPANQPRGEMDTSYIIVIPDTQSPNLQTYQLHCIHRACAY